MNLCFRIKINTAFFITFRLYSLAYHYRISLYHYNLSAYGSKKHIHQLYILPLTLEYPIYLLGH